MILEYILTLLRNDHKYVITRDENGSYHFFHGINYRRLTPFASRSQQVSSDKVHILFDTDHGMFQLPFENTEPMIHGLLEYDELTGKPVDDFELIEMKSGNIQLKPKPAL